MTDMFEALKAPFPPERIHWRVGSTNKDKTRGLALAYLDARDVMERLDTVCGPANWQCRYPHANGKTVCEIGINVRAANAGDVKFVIVGAALPEPEPVWVWKADGAGDTEFEAEKGALSDAFKRAAVRWGIGRYLYDIDAAWVEIRPAGKSYAITESELPRLQAFLEVGPQGDSEDIAAAALIRRISGCATPAAVDALVRDPAFRNPYRALSPAAQERVTAAGQQKRDWFSQNIVNA